MMPAPPTRSAALAAAAAVAALAACSDGGGTSHDASIDTPPGTCGADATFTGEIVDWDSTSAAFCGVFGATFTVRGDAARKSMTAPNGRFSLCVPAQGQTIVEIAPPTAASECPGLSGDAMNKYMLGGIAIASQAVLAAGGAYSARAMVEPRLVTMGTQIGAALDENLGQLVVHIDGTPRAVSISAAHDATQRFTGTKWEEGDTGSDVFFPNVAVGPATITVAGGAIGTGSYMIDRGVMTYLTVAVR